MSGERHWAARRMVLAIQLGIREACPDARIAESLSAAVEDLYNELTKDDSPVFRCALGAWEKR